MSFSDLMSSGRGPGVIGMVMALVVLLGFGLLFTFASDDSLQGADQSIESIIKHQEREMEALNTMLGGRNEVLAKVPMLLGNTRALEQTRREMANGAVRIEELKKSVDDGTAALAGVRTTFDAYKDEYRNMVRGKAKGETIARLETAAGIVYNNVNIREVTPVGIQIRHDEGQKRIAFEDLPAEMQERFQFDPNQKAAALTAESQERASHENDVAAMNARMDLELAQEKVQNEALAKKRAKEMLAAKQTQLRTMESELKSFERALQMEKKKPLSRAPAMEAQLARKREEVVALRNAVAQLKAMP